MANLTRQFIWTAIPAGRVETIGDRRMALFSLLLTPRLLGPQGTRLTVADFGMQSWPQRLAVASFKILRSATPINAQQTPHVAADGRQVAFSAHQQESAWQALFPGDMLVRPYRATSYSGRRAMEFPASQAGVEISGAYGRYARTLANMDGNAPEEGARRRSALQRITDDWLAGLSSDADPESATRAEGSALRQAYDFYRRDAAADFTLLQPLAESADTELDFHDVVARLADHPTLLRALGLLIDFAAPAAELAGDANREISATPVWPTPDANPPAGWPNASQEDLSPRTAFALSDSRFLPSAASPPHGLLPLQGTGPAGASANRRFEIMPFDVDGAALRMVSVAETYRDQPPFSGDGVPGLPTLRSAGFALVEKTRKAEHESRLERARQRSTVNGLIGSALTADNLRAGYRVDVFDEKTGQWRSLCQRRVRYKIGNVQIGQAAGALLEGLLEEGCLRPDSLTTGAGANDAVYIHQIVARWDGWSLVVPRPERVSDPSPEPPQQPFTVHIDSEPGSLPRLLFGRKYRLRARLADLAGGGLRSDQVAAAEQQTELLIHRRFEPIPPPELAPTRAYVDGEGHDKLVIRSDRDISAQDYAAAHGYRAFDLRYLFAPKCSLELALQHQGKFEASLGPGVADGEIARFFEIAKRADRDLIDAAGAESVQGANDSGAYVVASESPVELPWLADPMSTRASIIVRSRPIDPLTGRPGATEGFVDEIGKPKSFTWKRPWPNFAPIALKVIEAADGCKATMTTTGNQRTLTIALGPAQQATLDIVCCPGIDDVPFLGVANWAGATGDPSDPVTENVYYGMNPMTTPPRTITAAHAVQRPLKTPSGRLKPKRQARDTHVILDPNLSSIEGAIIDVPSTGRIDLRAAWTDIEDIPPNEPRIEKREAIVGSYDVEHQPIYLMSEIRQEFGDDRRRRVTYKATAVSRFHHYFGTIVATDPQACAVEGILEVTDVPSSARPPAPALRDLIPTFRWSREGVGTATIRSTRRGGGLRAFLERPWFVSGEEEMLAVLAWPQATPAPTVAARRCLSLAGRDPIWDAGAPPAVLNPGHFNAASDSLEFLPECGPNVKASAVVYPVHFDKEAGCWFADIDLSPLVAFSYFPFLRLGLARYQANTVSGIPRLSPPTVSEPIQILPDRDLSVRRIAGRATVAVSGIGTSASRPTIIQAELQTFEGDAAAAGDALIGPSGWRTIARKTGSLGGNLDLDIPQSGSRPMRISVTEAESYPPEGSSAIGAPTRLVYADIVPLQS